MKKGKVTSADNMTASNEIDLRDNYRTIFNRFEAFARNTRKDHIFIADVLKPLVVQGSAGKVLDDKSKNFSKQVYWPLRHQFGFANSNFATVYGNWAKDYDGTSDNQIWIPFSGVAAKIYAQNDANFAPWFAPAGLNRGGIDSAVQAYRKLTQKNRDDLYDSNVNPIATFPGQGVTVFGQKTTQKKASALDRVNVRRLLINIKSFVARSSRTLVFEQNTTDLRDQFLNTVNPFLDQVQSNAGLQAFEVIMDDTNNTPETIDRNQLVGLIRLQPTRTAEFIVLDFTIEPSGAAFDG